MHNILHRLGFARIEDCAVQADRIVALETEAMSYWKGWVEREKAGDNRKQFIAQYTQAMNASRQKRQRAALIADTIRQINPAHTPVHLPSAF